MHKFILFFCLLAETSLLTGQSLANEATLERISYTSAYDNSERDYYIYLPKGYNPEADRKWPVIFFLHGNGERGNGKEELPHTLTHGPLYEAWIQKRDLPFIIVQPQLHIHGFDQIPGSHLNTRAPDAYPKRLENGVPARTETTKSSMEMNGQLSDAHYPTKKYGLPMGWETVETDLLSMLAYVMSNYNSDASRVYLSGLSYGGFGTWYMASKHPDLFAAINPIVGWGHKDLMPSIAEKNIPIWCFAGGRDETIDLKYFYPGLNELEKLGHTNLRFTIEADMAHDVWKRVYAGEDIYLWFLQHQLK